MNGARALDLFADPREPARPLRDRHHPRRAPAGRDRCRHGEVHLGRDVPEAAVRRRLAREAAHDRSLDASQLMQLGWVKFRASAGELGPLPARRRLRRGRHRQPERGQPARRSRCSSASRRLSRRPIPSAPAASPAGCSSNRALGLGGLLRLAAARARAVGRGRRRRRAGSRTTSRRRPSTASTSGRSRSQ